MTKLTKEQIQDLNKNINTLTSYTDEQEMVNSLCSMALKLLEIHKWAKDLSTIFECERIGEDLLEIINRE